MASDLFEAFSSYYAKMPNKRDVIYGCTLPTALLLATLFLVTEWNIIFLRYVSFIIFWPIIQIYCSVRWHQSLFFLTSFFCFLMSQHFMSVLVH